jgi:ABC-type transport system substrate-binding protein
MLRRAFHMVTSMSRTERWVLGVCTTLFVLSLTGLLRQFYLENTETVPTTGGTYIEGSIGVIQPLNPWFTVQNDVNRDIVSLVFAGLLKYNPETKKIEPDLADFTVSKDSRTYTVTLKENLLWHDTTKEKLHPVTADDIVFTFQTIQEPGFPNLLLQSNFRGVTITKIDDRTVRFVLDKPYSFFPSNLTIGLLPAKSFEGIPVRKLDQALDFAYHPIGAGPYKFRSLSTTELSSEVTLERFDRPIPPPYHLDRIVFRIFSDYSTLLGDLRTLQGIRQVPKGKNGEPVVPKRFTSQSYTLPQYVALFFNLDKKALQDKELRLGLQLGTDKQSLTSAIHEPKIVDTPLLELDTKDWRYNFDSDAAQGALFASNWNLPEKIRLQHLLEQDEANRTGILHVSPVLFIPDGGILTLSGAIADIKEGYKINGVLVRSHASGAWIATLPTTSGTGAIKSGENLLRVTDEKGKTIDSAYVYRAVEQNEYKRALLEQQLVQDFLQTKAGTLKGEKAVRPQDLTLENGLLRRRTDKDPVSIRKNDRGEVLRLRLLTSKSPAQYEEVAQIIKEQWAALGVDVTIIIPDTREEFQDKLLKRDYDVLLFGQSLLDNLDSFPYWHSSGMQKTGKNQELLTDAYNLSQYSSFKADALLEKVRAITDEAERTKTLKDLQTVLKADVPAIFLYSPQYTFAYSNKIRGLQLGTLSLHSDRFLTMHSWYVKEERKFHDGLNWLSFYAWLPTLFN